MKFTRSNQVLILLFLVIIALTIIRGFLLSELATDSIIIVELTEQTEQVKRANDPLRESLLNRESLRVADQEAHKRGFVQATYYYP